MKLFKNLSPARMIATGFLSVIFIGSILLMLPISLNSGENLSYVNALFTATSAVCVTGLTTVETATTFSVFGRAVIAMLIQIGGLGVMSVGVGLLMLTGKHVSFKERQLVKESISFKGMGGVIKLLRAILIMTLCFEVTGTIINFFIFLKYYNPIDAFGVALFHTISSFNNAGFDVFGPMNGQASLISFSDNPLLLLVTAFLIIFGGLGFYTIFDILKTKKFKKFHLHTKVVLVSTVILLIAGTLIFKLTDNLSWLNSFFNSTTARTAGFATVDISILSRGGLFVLMILMFIGASPGSTGGGIKTTTVFTVLLSTFSAAANRNNTVFKRKIPAIIVTKAFMIALLAFTIIITSAFLIFIFEPKFDFEDILFEVFSAFGTVGLSTGITSMLSSASKVVIIVTMFVGRLGPLTAATLWTFKSVSSACYSEEELTIG
ncbi:MAG: H(+)-transporting ATPase [Clostridiales bacterium GWF2_38_85]|nr:MAG: H(+)-transporting ATPase [Clostridiales bacterium GWF2_38_85]HBL83833.1 H(+)-transporting ATPase [Clostridiales bacterium]